MGDLARRMIGGESRGADCIGSAPRRRASSPEPEEQLVLQLKKLSPEERVEVFQHFCTVCGTDELPCYCTRDE